MVPKPVSVNQGNLIVIPSAAFCGPPVGEAACREIQNAAATATMRNINMATIIHKFTFVVRRCTFTSGRPLLSLSIDIE